MAHPVSRLLRGEWLRQGAWTLADQALFAGANFVVNVLLARWLAPEAYGAFTVAFMVFLLAGTVHGGLLIEPMLVFGPERFKKRTGAYLRSLLGEHARYSVLAGAGLGAVAAGAWALGSPLLAALFGALALAQGAILALWLLRRACYVVSRPDWAAGAGALYLVLLVGGAVALDRVGALTGPAAFGLMGATSLVAGVALAVRLGVPVRAAEASVRAEARSRHAEYGRWAAPTGVVEWVQQAVPYLALPLFVGLEGSGALRAYYNLAMPALMGFAALATLALPTFVRARAEGTLRPTVAAVLGAFGGLAVAYGGLILLAGDAVIGWLYDGQYAAPTAVLVLLAVAPVLAAVANVLVALTRSAERPEPVFRARLATVGVVSTVGLGVTAALGVVGALLGDALGLLTEIAMLVRPARDAADAPPEADDPSPAAADSPAPAAAPAEAASAPPAAGPLADPEPAWT